MRDQGAVGLRQEGRDAGAARPRLGSLPPGVTGSGGVRAHARAASRPWAVQPLHGAEGLFSQACRLTPGRYPPLGEIVPSGKILISLAAAAARPFRPRTPIESHGYRDSGRLVRSLPYPRDDGWQESEGSAGDGRLPRGATGRSRPALVRGRADRSPEAAEARGRPVRRVAGASRPPAPAPGPPRRPPPGPPKPMINGGRKGAPPPGRGPFCCPGSRGRPGLGGALL